MKIAFFQPYLANWRIQFLEYFIANSSDKNKVIVYDGGFSSKKDDKSVTGNHANLKVNVLKSMSLVFNFSGQSYPLYFSPFLFFRLVYDKPDVVVTEGEINFINNISIWLYCLVFKKKYVWWSLGKVMARKKNVINKLFDPLVNFLINRASCIMARNTQAKNYYIKNGFSEKKVIVAPNSMDDERAKQEVDYMLLNSLKALKGSRKNMLYVGALVTTKRPADLIDVLDVHVNIEKLDYELWFVGSGPEEANLKLMASERGLADRIRFFGKVFNGVGSYFLASDVVVVPGLGGLVINHAMIFGTPVVSRPADGTEKDLIIDGKNGFIVSDYDNKNFANVVESLLNSGELKNMGIFSERHINEHWNIKIMFERVMRCIEYND